MYLPLHFKMEELGPIHAAMRASRLATLVTATADGLIGTPLPLILSEDEGDYGTLYGHVARCPLSARRWRSSWGPTPM